MVGSLGGDGDDRRSGARTAGAAGVSPPLKQPTVAFGGHLPSEADAASRMQAIQRGRLVRQRTSTKLPATEVLSKSAFGSHMPATPTPAGVGAGAATGAARSSEAEDEEEFLQQQLLQGMAETDEAGAATMMQARQRGRMTRRSLGDPRGSPAKRGLQSSPGKRSAPDRQARRVSTPAASAAAGGAAGRGTADNGDAGSGGVDSGGVGSGAADDGAVGLGAVSSGAAGGGALGTGAASGSGAGAGRCGAAEALTGHIEEAGARREVGADEAGPEEVGAASRLQARQRGRTARRQPRAAPAAEVPALSAEEALSQQPPPSPSKARRDRGSIGRYDATASGVPSSGLAAPDSGLGVGGAGVGGAAQLGFEPVRGGSTSGRRMGAAGAEPSPSAATDGQPSPDGRRLGLRGGSLHRGATLSACSAAEASAAAPRATLGREAAPRSPPMSRSGSPDARYRRRSTSAAAAAAAADSAPFAPSTPPALSVPSAPSAPSTPTTPSAPSAARPEPPPTSARARASARHSSQAREPVSVESAPSSQPARAPPLERRASTLTLEFWGGNGEAGAATRMQARQRGRIERRQIEQRQPRSQARPPAADLDRAAAQPEEVGAGPSRAELVARAQAAAHAEAAPPAPGPAAAASEAEVEVSAAALQQQQLDGRYEAGQLRLEKWIGAKEQRLVEQLHYGSQQLEAQGEAAADVDVSVGGDSPSRQGGAPLQSAAKPSEHRPEHRPELPGARSSAVLGQLGGARPPQPAPTATCGAMVPQSMQAAGAIPSAPAAAPPAEAALQTNVGFGEGRRDPEELQREVQRRTSQEVPPVAAVCGSGAAEAEAMAEAEAEAGAEAGADPEAEVGAKPAAELAAEVTIEVAAELPTAEPAAKLVAERHSSASPEQRAMVAPDVSPPPAPQSSLPPPRSPPTQLPSPVLAALAEPPEPSAPPASPAPPDASPAPPAPPDASPAPPASPEAPVSPTSPQAPQAPGDQSDKVDAHDVVAAVAALRVVGAVAVEATVEEWLRLDGGPPPANLLAKVGRTLAPNPTLTPTPTPTATRIPTPIPTPIPIPTPTPTLTPQP